VTYNKRSYAVKLEAQREGNQ